MERRVDMGAAVVSEGDFERVDAIVTNGVKGLQFDFRLFAAMRLGVEWVGKI
jgi:hypothetical protein